MVEPGPSFSDGGGIREHTDSSVHLGQVSSRNGSRRLVVDSDLESGRTPVNELDGLLRLDGGNRGVHVLGNHVTAVQQAAGHVLASAGIALDHLQQEERKLVNPQPMALVVAEPSTDVLTP